MKLKNLGYKAIALSFGASLLFGATSCKDDFLEGKIYDQVSSQSFTTYESAMSLTGMLYGGKVWNQYESKFFWVMEGAAGNLYNTYQNEGMAYLLQFNASNDVLELGYQSLYSGVISTANQVINYDFSKTNLSEQQRKEVIAEAKLWRGFAHFLATEYWGEVPLVLNNEKDIAGNIRIPKATRAVIYAAVEKDLQEAIQDLPESRDGKYELRATSWSAKALLAKLYLTIAANFGTQDGNAAKFSISDLGGSSAEYYQKVIDLTTEIINSGKFSLATHAAQFAAHVDMSPETILAFHFSEAGWAEGAQYQCQMANADMWSPGAGWGAGKGIAYTLYHDFEDNDPRKKELCMYAGQTYTTASGVQDSYVGDRAYDLLSSIGVLNNVKKFVYGLSGSGHFMSIWARYDVVRLSEVYMMRQEAKMLKGGNVSAPCADLEDLNTVLRAHGATPKTGSMAFYTEVKADTADLTYTEAGTGKVYTSRNAQGNLHPFPDANKTQGITGMYHETHRTDFIQELRKEFAMEGQGWLQLKRLYYMSPEAAKNFIKEQDRGCIMAIKSEIDPTKDKAKASVESGYERLALHNDILNQRIAAGEDVKIGSQEEVINVEGFINDCKWFLPFPSNANVVNKMSNSVYTDVNAVRTNNYPY